MMLGSKDAENNLDQHAWYADIVRFYILDKKHKFLSSVYFCSSVFLTVFGAKKKTVFSILFLERHCLWDQRFCMRCYINSAERLDPKPNPQNLWWRLEKN